MLSAIFSENRTMVQERLKYLPPIHTIAMVTTESVRQAFGNVANANIDHIDADGLFAEVTVSDKQAGAFFKTLRENDYDFEAKRLGDRLVAHIEVDDEREGLGNLFG